MYADFVVWTVADIHIERILPDAEFWLDLVSKATEFYKKCLLPELVGKFYSRSSCPLPDHLLTDTDTEIVPLSNTNHGKESEIASISPEKWCYCGGQEENLLSVLHIGVGHVFDRSWPRMTVQLHSYI